MIDPRELRIGNAILINGEVVHPIGYGVIMDVAQKAKGIKNNYLDTLTHSPVELTEEWLLKFGFEPVFDGFKKWINVVDGKLLYFTTSTSSVILEHMPHGRFYIKNIKYVHQLQNIYFSLTGKELEAKQ